MKNPVKIKNVCILIFTYITGFLSALLFVYYKEIDLRKIYSLVNRETSIPEEIEVEEVPEKEENNGSIIEEKVEETDSCPILAAVIIPFTVPFIFFFIRRI